MVGVAVVTLSFGASIKPAAIIAVSSRYAVPIADVISNVGSTPTALDVYVIVPVSLTTNARGIIRAVNFTEAGGAIVESIVISRDETASISLLVLILVTHVLVISGIVVFHLRFELIPVVAIVGTLMQAVAIAVLVTVLAGVQCATVIFVFGGCVRESAERQQYETDECNL